MTKVLVHQAQRQAIRRLQEIEVLAGQPFRSLGMDAVADDPPPSDQQYADYIDRQDAWVIRVDGSPIVGYLLLDTLDGNLHIEQVTIDPMYARRGLGARLIRFAAQLGLDRRLTVLPADRPGLITLTTFRDVLWNAPYYKRLGFRVVDEPHWGDEMRALRRREHQHGLDAWPRVVLAADLLSLISLQ